MTLTIFLLSLALNLFAPEYRVLYIPEPVKVEPYERLYIATCQVESNFNPLAIGDKHLKHWSYGIVQIRKERLDDYNRRTGSHYTINDLFNPDISKQIYMYYASEFGPYRIDDGIRAWNGSGAATWRYLKKIKAVL